VNSSKALALLPKTSYAKKTLFMLPVEGWAVKFYKKIRSQYILKADF
jgi:hypothetical protein